MKHKISGSNVWLMPEGATPLAQDGRQLFYATADGSGSVIDLGDLVKSAEISFEIDTVARGGTQEEETR